MLPDDTAAPPDAGRAPPAEPEPLLIDLAAAARLLSLSLKTCKRMAAADELPGVVKLRRRRLVRLDALRAWIADGCPELTPAAPRKRRPR